MKLRIGPAARRLGYLAVPVVLMLPALFGFNRSADGSAAPTKAPSSDSTITAPVEPQEIAREVILEQGETLGALLERSDLTREEQTQLIERISDYRDPRRIRPGLMVRWTRSGEQNALQRIEVPLNPDSTLVVDARDSVWTEGVEVVDVESETVVLAGSVETSLYNAIVHAGEDTDIPVAERRAVVDILAEQIFAWQIDFSRDLRQHDSFWVIYDRDVRPDGTARSSSVRAVQFMVDGRNNEAYRFVHADGSVGYYDREGESMKRMFLRAPLEFRRISSQFNPNRLHPILKRRRPHNGVDYAAATGTPIRATADGRVASAGRNGGYGIMVELSHARGYKSRYAHMSRLGPGIRRGVRVSQGQVIGYVGTTGLSNGPHLHYELHENGRPVNPRGAMFRTGEPVPEAQRAAYRSAIAGVVADLDSLRESATVEVASN